MREVRKKQKNFYKFLKGLVIFSVVFIFVYIGAQPYVKSFNETLAVAVNYACDILVIINLVVIFLYYSKYGKVESFLKDIENELEDAGYYINSRDKESIEQRCMTISKICPYYFDFVCSSASKSSCSLCHNCFSTSSLTSN